MSVLVVQWMKMLNQFQRDHAVMEVQYRLRFRAGRYVVAADVDGLSVDMMCHEDSGELLFITLPDVARVVSQMKREALRAGLPEPVVDLAVEFQQMEAGDRFIQDFQV